MTGVLRRRKEDTQREEDHVKTDAEIGMMLP